MKDSLVSEDEKYLQTLITNRYHLPLDSITLIGVKMYRLQERSKKLGVRK